MNGFWMRSPFSGCGRVSHSVKSGLLPQQGAFHLVRSAFLPQQGGFHSVRRAFLPQQRGFHSVRRAFLRQQRGFHSVRRAFLRQQQGFHSVKGPFLPRQANGQDGARRGRFPPSPSTRCPGPFPMQPGWIGDETGLNRERTSSERFAGRIGLDERAGDIAGAVARLTRLAGLRQIGRNLNRAGCGWCQDSSWIQKKLNALAALAAWEGRVQNESGK